MGEVKLRAARRREAKAANKPEPVYAAPVPRMALLSDPISKDVWDLINLRLPMTGYPSRGAFIDTLLRAGIEIFDAGVKHAIEEHQKQAALAKEQEAKSESQEN